MGYDLPKTLNYFSTMYTQIWSKYLPIIKILLKRSANGNQTLELNRIDFERAGTGRKAGRRDRCGRSEPQELGFASLAWR